MHIGDVATDSVADAESEYEEIIEEYEEDGVPEAPVDFSADPVQNRGKPQNSRLVLALSRCTGVCLGLAS